DGIRYRTVTGVQTCALPISNLLLDDHSGGKVVDAALSNATFFGVWIQSDEGLKEFGTEVPVLACERVCGLRSRHSSMDEFFIGQIGRASCRERVVGEGVDVG